MVFVCRDRARARECTRFADAALKACRAYAGEYPFDWEYPGRQSILFASERDMHEGLLRAYGVQLLPPAVRVMAAHGDPRAGEGGVRIEADPRATAPGTQPPVNLPRANCSRVPDRCSRLPFWLARNAVAQPVADRATAEPDAGIRHCRAKLQISPRARLRGFGVCELIFGSISPRLATLASSFSSSPVPHGARRSRKARPAGSPDADPAATASRSTVDQRRALARQLRLSAEDRSRSPRPPKGLSDSLPCPADPAPTHRSSSDRLLPVARNPGGVHDDHSLALLTR